MQVNLSFAIVSMVNSTRSGDGGTSGSDVCKNLLPNNSHLTTTSSLTEEGDALTDGEFNWTGEEQGIILGSFFWGYVITQVPG